MYRCSSALPVPVRGFSLSNATTSFVIMGNTQALARAKVAEKNRRSLFMMLTTSHNIEGKTISEYLDIVSIGVGATLPKLKDISKRNWKAGVDEANEILKEQAASLGADAVVAIRYNHVYQSWGYMVFATGTAVKF